MSTTERGDSSISRPHSPPDLDFADIHERILPGDVRLSDRIVARIRHRTSDGPYIDARVWRMSPLGIELVYPDDGGGFRQGEPIDLEVTIGGQRSHYEGLVVDIVQEGSRLKLIGIRLSHREETARSTHENRRRHARWLCSEEFYPTCIAPSPGKFNDFIYFQIRDMSKDGVQLVCSLRNKYLITGMRMNLSASFPMVGETAFAVRIVRVGITSDRGKDKLIVGATFEALSDQARNTIGQYLIQFSNASSLEELRTLGLAPASLSKGVDFYFLRSEEDYRAVLELRLASHIDAGNVNDGTSVSQMGDMNDSRSRILVGKYRGEVIATARIRFNTIDEPLEQETYVEWPKELPRRDQIIELSRTCIHPDFQRNDLMISMLRFIAMTCIRDERPWVLIVSLPYLVPFYEKIGMRDTGITHQEKFWNGVQHLLLIRPYDAMVGRGVHPLYWNLIWREISDYLIEHGDIKPIGIDGVRRRVYRAVGAFLRFAAFRAKPRRKQGTEKKPREQERASEPVENVSEPVD